MFSSFPQGAEAYVLLCHLETPFCGVRSPIRRTDIPQRVNFTDPRWSLSLKASFPICLRTQATLGGLKRCEFPG